MGWLNEIAGLIFNLFVILVFVILCFTRNPFWIAMAIILVLLGILASETYFQPDDT